MRDKDVIQHIQDLCKERSWTYYRLAKEADIPYSTLNNMVNRTNIPTIPTLQNNSREVLMRAGFTSD